MSVQLKKILFFTLVFSFTVCTSIAFSEEVDPDCTSTMISESANAAGLFFLATPNTETYKVQQGVAAFYGFIWANEIPKKDGSESKLFTDGANQLSSESGFTFIIQTTGATDGKTAILGLNANFPFTPENLGQEKYNLMRAKVEAEPDYEGWVEANSLLADLGLSVNCRYPDGKERDITSLITAFINQDMLFSYGAVIVDRAVTDKEGQLLYLSDEEEALLSDGKADNVITGTWWIADNERDGGESGGSSGCSTGAPGALAVLIAAAAIAIKSLKI
jgi:hypothetical protein